jgi:hypothetical protein
MGLWKKDKPGKNGGGQQMSQVSSNSIDRSFTVAQ